MMEEWRDIPSLVDYQASNLGRIRSTLNKRFKPAKPGHTILKSQRERDGRYRVSIRIKGVCKRHLVHKLVMEAFVGPCPNGHQVNHIDGDHTNNVLSNLEYITQRANYDHSIVHALHPRNDAHHGIKLSEQDVRDILKELQDPSWGKSKELAQKYGVSQTWISAIKTRKSRTYVDSDWAEMKGVK